MTIQENLKTGVDLLKKNNIESPNVKCKILLAHLLGKKREYLIIHLMDELNEIIQKQYDEALLKLIENVPIQYITNTQEFMGFKFYVDENVLIPRADTEILVEEVIKRIPKKKSIKVLDMCTGSGAIAISIAKNIENARVTATDISKSALEVAKRNSTINETKIEIIESNLFENVQETFDIIISNPPYVETETINNLEEQVKKEPKIALDGGKDGLKFYRLIAQYSKQYLNQNGMLALEIGYNQKKAVMELLEEEQYSNIICIKDLGENDRVVICHKE